MKLLRALLATFVLWQGLSLSEATLEAQWPGWYCQQFYGGGNCAACNLNGFYSGYTWPTSCGESCVCRWYAIGVWTEDENGLCIVMCDFGYDGHCDCSGWV